MGAVVIGECGDTVPWEVARAEASNIRVKREHDIVRCGHLDEVTETNPSWK